MVKSHQQSEEQRKNRPPYDEPALPVEWRHFTELAPYQSTIDEMERQVAAIHRHQRSEQVWLLEHPALYTAGTSAKNSDLLAPARFPVFETGRGGQYTYHGPGQRICYVMLDLNSRGRDVRQLVTSMEHWVIKTLAHFGVRGEIRDGRVGVWVARPEKPLVNGMMREDKIAAIGIRVRRWVSFHGLSFNVSPDLEHYSGIVPCGIAGHGVTSLHDLGVKVTMDEVDAALKRAFIDVFHSQVNETVTATLNLRNQN